MKNLFKLSDDQNQGRLVFQDREVDEKVDKKKEQISPIDLEKAKVGKENKTEKIDLVTDMAVSTENPVITDKLVDLAVRIDEPETIEENVETDIDWKDEVQKGREEVKKMIEVVDDPKTKKLLKEFLAILSLEDYELIKMKSKDLLLKAYNEENDREKKKIFENIFKQVGIELDPKKEEEEIIPENIKEHQRKKIDNMRNPTVEAEEFLAKKKEIETKLKGDFKTSLIEAFGSSADLPEEFTKKERLSTVFDGVVTELVSNMKNDMGMPSFEYFIKSVTKLFPKENASEIENILNPVIGKYNEITNDLYSVYKENYFASLTDSKEHRIIKRNKLETVGFEYKNKKWEKLYAEYVKENGRKSKDFENWLDEQEIGGMERLSYTIAKWIQILKELFGAFDFSDDDEEKESKIEKRSDLQQELDYEIKNAFDLTDEEKEAFINSKKEIIDLYKKLDESETFEIKIADFKTPTEFANHINTLSEDAVSKEKITTINAILQKVEGGELFWKTVLKNNLKLETILKINKYKHLFEVDENGDLYLLRKEKKKLEWNDELIEEVLSEKIREDNQSNTTTRDPDANLEIEKGKRFNAITFSPNQLGLEIAEDGKGLDAEKIVGESDNLLVATNAALFHNKKHPEGLIIQNGEVLWCSAHDMAEGKDPKRMHKIEKAKKNKRWLSVFYIKNGKAYVEDSDDFNQNYPNQSYYSGISLATESGPVLMKDGKLKPGNFNIFSGHRPRTVIGVKASGEVVLCCMKGASLKQTAEKLQELGVVDAMNLDGGGSTEFATAEGADIKTNRKVNTVFTVSKNA